MPVTFKYSDEFTLGIEVEAQLVDKDTLGLIPTSSDIIDGIEGYEESIKHELMMSNLEINTRVCAHLDQAAADLYKKFDLVLSEAANHNTLVSLAGTHPFSTWKEQVITDNERYKRLLNNLQGVARRFNIFGLHVHVGIGDSEKCIYIMNRMLYYLPYFLALSANSPFWEGENTGLRSFRIKIFESLPTAGLPFYFRNFSDYMKVVDNYIVTGTIETIREIWWDIRPHPDFGTLELRICDTPSTIEEILAIAALIQALVARLGDEYERGVPFVRPHSSVISFQSSSVISG